jgi:lactate dehydrogenase-like 2-hydroxyacid dehydrogenase
MPAVAADQSAKFEKVVLLAYVDSDFDEQVRSHVTNVTEKVIAVTEGNESIAGSLAGADCLLVEPGIAVDGTLLDAALKLRYLCIYGTDHSRVDVAHATRRGVTVCNTPGYSTGAVAEFVFGVILDQIRGLAPAKSRVRDGRYTELGTPGTEIAGKQFGVVGLGRIGRRVAEIAKHGFGANVHYWSRNRKPDIEQAGIGYADIATLLRNSDFISIHVPRTAATERLVSAERIEQIRPGAVVVHLSPIELIDLDALEQRLKRSDMTIILDHTDELPAERIKALARFSNCVMYPAIACTTQEAKRAKLAILMKNIEGFLAGCPNNLVTNHG